MGADGAVAEEVERGAGGLVETPEGDFHPMIAVNRVAPVNRTRDELLWQSPQAVITVQLAQHYSLDANSAAPIQKLDQFVAVVFGQHAGDFDRHNRLPHNFGQIRHAGRPHQFLIGIRLERREGNTDPIILVENVHLVQGQLAVGVQRVANLLPPPKRGRAGEGVILVHIGSRIGWQVFSQPLQQPRLVAVKLGIGGCTRKNYFRHPMLLDEFHKPSQIPQRKLIQIIPV